jgi:pimeloyl-ACP methyl ester carboxylesterase
MQREQHVVDELHAYRYRGEDARYALVVSHGIASHGGIYDVFCCHHAAKGVDIWSYDAPGHGKSTTNRPRGQWTMQEWASASVTYAEHVRRETGLPVFTLGSSLGVAAAFSALHSDAISGAILMGSPAVPGSPAIRIAGQAWRAPEVEAVLNMVGRAARLDCGIFFNFDEDYGYAGAGEQKRADPWNTWSYDLASWRTLFTWDPPIPPEQNSKPVLVACGEKDPSFPPETMKGVADAIAGPVEFYCLPEGKHQLMLFHTDAFSAEVDRWVGAQLAGAV